MQTILARSISYIFSPLTLWPIFLLILLYGTGLSDDQQRTLGLPVLILELVVPTILLATFIKLKLISDLDVTQVKQRRLFFVLVLIAHALSLALLWHYGNSETGITRYLGFIVEVIGTVITFAWKISGHLAVNSFVIAVMVMLFGWQWLPLLIILPVVAWARVYLKRHTVAQTIAGSVLPLIIVWGVGALFTAGVGV